MLKIVIFGNFDIKNIQRLGNSVSFFFQITIGNHRNTSENRNSDGTSVNTQKQCWRSYSTDLEPRTACNLNCRSLRCSPMGSCIAFQWSGFRRFWVTVSWPGGSGNCWFSIARFHTDIHWPCIPLSCNNAIRKR